MAKRDGKRSRAFRAFAWRQWPFCQWCERRLRRDEATTDHIVPLDRGGTNHIYNLCISCEECNHARGNQLADRPLFGPRWTTISRAPGLKRVFLLIPLTKEPALLQYRRRTGFTHETVLAFPLSLPMSVQQPAMGAMTGIACTHFKTGDMLVVGETQPNGDPLVYVQDRRSFSLAWEPVLSLDTPKAPDVCLAGMSAEEPK